MKTRRKPHRWLWATSPDAEEWNVCRTIEECIDEWRETHPDGVTLFVRLGERTTAVEREEMGVDWDWHCTNNKPIEITP